YLAEYRRHVGREGVAPLRSVLDVAPTCLLRSNESISALIEGHHARSFKRSVGSVCSPSFDRINSLIPQLSTLQGFVACFREVDRVERAQAHLTLDIVHLSGLAGFGVAGGEAKDPRAINRAVALSDDLEIEAATVSKHPHSSAVFALSACRPSRFDFALR